MRNLTYYSISRSRSLHVIRLELNLTKSDNFDEDDSLLEWLVQSNGGLPYCFIKKNIGILCMQELFFWVDGLIETM